MDALVEQEDEVDGTRAGKRGAMRFDRLRLDGFKSFADRAEIDIQPGLTGIVGPNGCGKSNLLEALKWALGETSAKRMRGEGMDDVIFGGTERRPARNVAEVGIYLDNRMRTAPPGMNDDDTLEVVRRIERGQGTSYKANGRPIRLKDAQILFQDNASGAGSSAIVSQGRVNALINAKASERRGVLEEAAGVAGLTTRRNDFRNKLAQTETNLARAEDALAEAGYQGGQLRKQMRALQRWREFDSRIRTTAATMLLSRLMSANARLAEANAKHEDNEKRIADAMLGATAATARRERAMAALPLLREARTNADIEAARAQARLESIDNEAERFSKELFELQQRDLELSADRAREDQSIDEARRSLAQRQEEQAELAEVRAGDAERLELQSDAVEDAATRVEKADAALAQLSSALASAEAERAALRKQRDEAERRLAAVEARLKQAEGRLQAASAALPDPRETAERSASVESLAESVEAMSSALDRVETELEGLRVRLEQANAAVSTIGKDVARKQAELEGLASIRDEDEAKEPISALIRIEPGYEMAVAAALGDALRAGTDANEALWWRSDARAEPVSAAAPLLSDFVGGVPALVPFLSRVVVVDEDALEAGFPLAPGVIRVTRSGRFRRWDGFGGRREGDSVEAALVRRARMAALGEELSEDEPRLSHASAEVDRLRQAMELQRQAEARLRQDIKGTTERLRLERDVLMRLQASGEDARREMAVAESELRAIRVERQTALQEFGATGDALAAIPEDVDAQARLVAAKADLAKAREAESSARVALERIGNEQASRRARADALMREMAEWQRRLQQATERRADLSRRYEEMERLRKDLETRKATPAEAREEARIAAEAARSAAEAAAARMDEGEAERNGAEEESRRMEAEVATCREARATILGMIAQAQAALEAVRVAAAERLSAEVESLQAIAGVEDGAILPDAGILEAQLHRLENERENFGPVNFLAEQELEEHEKRLGDMEKGRQEIRDAVVKLNEGIKRIEEEARGKLEEAFSTIDASFGRLFVNLFGGGQAHLKLVGEDILDAGLEIYASPPGKRLQILSLLSGGEQTLTAMALIFAAFLSNPSPICVLDEADAALDDSNTDLLIRLVESMASQDATRFLVVTHNPLTMARMNRLYGVTMQDRGISTVSRIDLDAALEIIEEKID